MAADPVAKTIVIKKGIRIDFDQVGDMGRNELAPLHARAFDKTTNRLLALGMQFEVVSGPALIRPGPKVKSSPSDMDTVVVKVTTVDPNAAFSDYLMASKTITFEVNEKQGQQITMKHGEKGGLRDLPISRKPIPIGRMVGATSGLPITLTLVGGPKVLKVVGTGSKALLVFQGKAAGFTGLPRTTPDAKNQGFAVWER